jgi:DNA repair exonuclease SbcCD ATPase subunit
MIPLERFRQDVEEYSARVKELEKLTEQYRVALATTPPNHGEANRLKADIDATLAELDERSAKLDRQRDELSKVRDVVASAV